MEQKIHASRQESKGEIFDQTGQSMAPKDSHKRDLKDSQCFKCREFGHICTNCLGPDIPKDGWWINKQKKLSAAQKQVKMEHIDESFKQKAECVKRRTDQDTTQKSVSWSRI